MSISPDMPELTLGVEEEYLLVDPETRDLASRPPRAFMERCQAAIGSRVTHEFLQSQVEVGTSVCRTVTDVRDELVQLRRTISDIAREFGLAMIAASTHPWAVWHQQVPVEMERYRILTEAHQGLARRMVICGTHVHAGIENQRLRIELMNQATYFLPHLLALSTSSPFWEGFDTGLKAFRPTIFGNLPRSGLPEHFESFADWNEMLQLLADTELCDDPTKIWWDIRPSAKHPTLEMRICDMCTRVEDTVTIAALYQAILAFLYHLRANNQSWRRYRRIFLAENKWRAQRYGVNGSLADLGRRTLVPLSELIEELLGLLAEHAEKRGCLREIERARTILENGTSADQQLRIYKAALADGADEREAQVRVVDWLIEASLEGVSG
jgi:carboxylate-amine ligase